MIRILLIVVLLLYQFVLIQNSLKKLAGVSCSMQMGNVIQANWKTHWWSIKENDQWFKDASKAEKNKANLTIQTAYSLPSYNDKELNKQQLNDFIAYEYLACKKVIELNF